MNLSIILRPILFSILTCFSSTLLSFTSSILSIIPSTEHTLELPENETAIIQYAVINNTNTARVMRARLPQGITQIILNKQSCSNPLKLEGNKSCILALKVDGKTLADQVDEGPILCQEDKKTPICTQPIEKHRVHLKKTNSQISMIRVAPTLLILDSEQDIPSYITVTNLSKINTAREIHLNVPDNWKDLIINDSDCSSLSPNSKCQIEVKSSHMKQALPITEISLQGINTTAAKVNLAVETENQISVSLAETAINDSKINLSTCRYFTDFACVISLYINGPSVNVTVTNNSSTRVAKGITADFTNTALAGKVTANTCPDLDPNQQCILTFTPGDTPVSLTGFSIKGTNTLPVTASLEITLLLISCDNIYATGCNLFLSQVSPIQSLYITNNSNQTITNIARDFSSTVLFGAMIEDNMLCMSLDAGETCNLIYSSEFPLTPVIADFPINGDHSTTVIATIKVESF